MLRRRIWFVWKLFKIKLTLRIIRQIYAHEFEFGKNKKSFAWYSKECLNITATTPTLYYYGLSSNQRLINAKKTLLSIQLLSRMVLLLVLLHVAQPTIHVVHGKNFDYVQYIHISSGTYWRQRTIPTSDTVRTYILKIQTCTTKQTKPATDWW